MSSAMSIRSKILVRPSKGRRAFIIFLKFSVLFILISMAVSFVASGFHFGVLLGGTIPAAILAQFTAMEQNKEHYENTFAEITFGDAEMQIHYQPSERQDGLHLNIAYDNIVQVRRSVPNHCFRLDFKNPVEGASAENAHLLYMEDVSCQSFMNLIRNKTDLQIQMLE